jgi:alkylhydroperoxidase/carboxymuconolactone decarboxylase family protein YurZ
MRNSSPLDSSGELHDLFADTAYGRALQELTPVDFSTAAAYYRAAWVSDRLPVVLRELVLLALAASPAVSNREGVKRQIARAKAAGASVGEVLGVLHAIIGVGNHPIYSAIPLLLSVLHDEGRELGYANDVEERLAALKDEARRKLGYWNDQRDELARVMPDYFEGLMSLFLEPGEGRQSLSTKDRELIYIAVDCHASHLFEPGLKLHFRNALRAGATPQEIIAVLGLASASGLESYVMGAEALLTAMEE